jgi:hypothetical protein
MSRQTRTNPARTTKAAGTTLRQTSYTLNPVSALPIANLPESHGFYPAIQHFADAITALPRDYRRHTSLLKEVDAKAWQLEDHLQKLLTNCLSAGPATLPEDALMLSAANSVTGVPTDAASQISAGSVASVAVQHRQLFAALRHNLMQIMVTMDEKNHVINNSNEELSRHIRRLDSIWPHLSDEISEEARLGSLKHWAYTETNATKKSNAPTTRREAAANLAMLHDNEVASRSETRREAVAAKSKQRLAQIDASLEESRISSKKATAEAKRRAAEAADMAGLGISPAAPGKRKKTEKSLASMAMDKSISNALGGSRAMSREPSQQENTKKRKAPAASTNVARKRYASLSSHIPLTYPSHRINAAQDSPKLASSPLASGFGKDAYKRSPALGAARPATSRARQQPNQIARPGSAASQRNGNQAQDANGAKNKDAAKADDETRSNVNGESSSRPGQLLERRASKQSALENANKSADSPKLSIATMNTARGRASKTSTPVVGTFQDIDSSSTANGNGNGNNGRVKRPARPRAKDHGLHDSLSPKGLPLKRSHKKGAALLPQLSRKETSSTTLPNDDDEENFSGAAEGENELEGEDGEDEERYCYCEGPSYGEMVACDNDQCPRQWFHLECLGLKNVPTSKDWYCAECKGSGNGGRKGSTR